MKTTVRRITALFLILLMTASLLASCKSGGEEETVTEVDGIPVFEHYKSSKVDLGLSENEVIYDIIEIDGMLRATVGVLDPNWDPLFPDEYIGRPYPTEHRWYSLDYVEDTAKREKTTAYHEITFVSEPSVDFVFGAEPFEDEWGKGVWYDCYQDGEPRGTILEHPELLEELGGKWSQSYSIMAHVMMVDGIPYVSFHHGATDRATGITSRENSSYTEYLFVNDEFVNTTNWQIDFPEYAYRGLIGIQGVPYALLEIKEKGCLVPLTAETTEIIPEGTEIDGCPTGGAFTDGRFGYFMSGTELWRTDGEESKCLIDLVPHGCSLTSMVRSVRALSDGRLLVSMDGKLIELSESDGSDTTTICDIGVIEYFEGLGEIGDLSLLISKYNDQAEQIFFRVKEYDDVGNLNLAVLSGDVDLVITPNKFILNNYVKQNLLAPLEEVAPALFEKDVLIESVVDATKMDGVCYYLPLNFEICGESITDPGLLPNGTLFETREEYYDFILANDPEYLENNKPAQILDRFARDLDEWIDWENNSCHFDDGSFAALLELCGKGNTQEDSQEFFSVAAQFEEDWGRKQKANSFVLEDGVESYRFTDVKSALAYRKTLPETEGVGGPTTWIQVDFPMPSRVHEGYEIDAHNLYAIADHEDSKAACADLLQWLILEDLQEVFPENDKNPFAYTVKWWDGFSINKKETEQYLNRLINSYLDPEAEAASANPEAVEIDPYVPTFLRFLAQQYNAKCGQAQYDATWDYIEKADHLRYYDSELHRVIRNEAQSYFSGSITAEQAADYVQNRISLYLAEQS
ncbi:MAG: hypothetical protein E7428_03005 [Ruminococcaceae bacterium]|nr:hypothetical protein [Oscillospiraceae bacterium]